MKSAVCLSIPFRAYCQTNYLQISKKAQKKHPSKGPKRSKFHKQTPGIEYEGHQKLISWDESDLHIGTLKVFED